MGQIFDDLLIKAQRDKSKLVQVQRSVSRGGKTFMQNFWVSPNQVKSTDKVIGGQQNLLPQPGSVAKPASGVLDKAYFDSIKSDRTKALDYLKSCGVTWNDHSHAGINWMRANQAFTAALAAQGGQKISPQGKSQSTPKNQPSAQNSASGSQSKSVVLTPAQQAEVDAGKNGKEKVVILKKLLGKDGCMQYAKQLGVQWDEHSFDAINNMRMSMALTKHFDTADGTVSPTGGKAGNKGGGAPNGNQNAKKDSTQAQQPAPPDDKIEIKSSFTSRQKALAEMINKIDNPADLQLFKSTGIIAEDDEAKLFIQNNLKKAYFGSSQGGSRDKSIVSVSEFAKNSASNISATFKGLSSKTMRKGLEALITSPDSSYSSGLDIGALLYPRDLMTCIGGLEVSPYTRGWNSVSGYHGHNVASMCTTLSDSFSQLTTDDSQNNMGYLGYDISKSKSQLSQFGIEKTGVGAVLTHIAEQDKELSSEAQSMKQDYADMLNICNGSFPMLEDILSERTNWETIVDAVNDNNTTKNAMSLACKELNQLKTQYGLSVEDIDYTLKQMSSGSSLAGNLFKADGTWVLDNTGNQVEVFSKLQGILVTNDNFPGKTSNLVDVLRLKRGYSETKYLAAMIRSGKEYDDITAEDITQAMPGIYLWGSGEEAIAKRDKAKAYGSITEQDYMKIRQKMFSFSGQKLQKELNGQYSDVDISTLSAKEFDEMMFSYGSKKTLRVVSDGDNLHKDVILANMLNICQNSAMLRGIHDSVPHDCYPSKANDNGNNFGANFSCYIGGRTQIRKMYYNSPALTTSEINDSVSERLNSSPMITTAQYKQLQDFIKKNGTVSKYSSLQPGSREEDIKKAESYSICSESNVDKHKDTPIHDILVGHLQTVAKYCPQMKNTRVKTDEDVAKVVDTKLGHIPYMSVTDVSSLPQGALKQLREETLGKVHCSLKTADQQQRSTIETRVKHDWDKEKRSSSGKRLYGHISCKFHGVYQINNSEADEKFRENVQRTGEKVQSFFHGTDFRGCCGIVGVDGQFRAPKNAADAAKNGMKYAGGMLGPGVYLADLAGKSAGYFGNWGSGYAARGALLVCDAILGSHATASDYSSVKSRMDVDSVSMKAGTNTGRTVLRADEWCIRRNDYVSPQFIVDAESVPR